MAHFYGTLKGNRGAASRLGTKGSGLQVSACSWQGRIDVYLRHDERTGKDHYAIKMDTHGYSQGWRGYIAEGVLGVAPEMPTLLPMPTTEALLAKVPTETLERELRRRQAEADAITISQGIARDRDAHWAALASREG